MAPSRIGMAWLSISLSLAAALCLPGCGEVRAPGQGRGGDALRVRRTAPVRPVADPRILAARLIAQQPVWPGRRPKVQERRNIQCKQVKCVALTFDDGPFDYTGTLLDTLYAHQAKATFFVVGQMVNAQTAPFLQRMVAEGHEIGNHSWDHPSLTGLSPDALRSQLDRTQQVVRTVTGVTMRLMRPPYGNTDGKVADGTRGAGLAQILWDLDTLDWRDRNTPLIVQRASVAQPGAIVLMHDIHKTTVEAVPRLLQELEAKGYTFVTVSELFGDEQLVPGRRYAGETGESRVAAKPRP
ncbi:polysaccharide deacetylase family protein [Sphaerisporangium fuscum]|uniref:polysaccharide deacetylase family protein n=1 Tax=Sphaerisporangium fuscum TaxID=2835868 RepID=UPI0027E23482|nr:polysaccharide deacetylase family protein [Sphaerisporangium fuscum]